MIACTQGTWLTGSQQRPFVNYYGVNLILYEMSTPFLNIHWFLDKINMTGSRVQLYNGILLITTFGLCRLVWGVYQSLRMYRDICTALQTPDKVGILAYDVISSICGRSPDPTSEGLDPSGAQTVPLWLACAYLGSNTMLSTLNFYWFGKMIEAVTKRFQSPSHKIEQQTLKADDQTEPISTTKGGEFTPDRQRGTTRRANALSRDTKDPSILPNGTTTSRS